MCVSFVFVDMCMYVYICASVCVCTRACKHVCMGVCAKTPQLEIVGHRFCEGGKQGRGTLTEGEERNTDK